MEGTGYKNLGFEDRQKIVNSYDNTILYTDFFLGSLISKLDRINKDAVLLFVADHGENLYDDNRKYFAHGTEVPTKYEYHIPYFIWYSDSYEKNNTQKIENLKKNLQAAASSTVTFYTLLDLANIKYKNSEIEISTSLASENYIIPKPVITSTVLKK